MEDLKYLISEDMLEGSGTKIWFALQYLLEDWP
jgi:hypothetical protein